MEQFLLRIDASVGSHSTGGFHEVAVRMSGLLLTQ
jgi:hypothetical protein